MLKEVFLSNACLFHLTGAEKKDIFEQMADQLYAEGRITDKEVFIQALLKREHEGPTGMGNEVAIPHGKSSCVTAPTVIFGRHPQGVAYESLDDLPVKYLFMIAVPETTADTHLKILATLARKLMHPDFIEHIKQAESGSDIAALL